MPIAHLERSIAALPRIFIESRIELKAVRQALKPFNKVWIANFSVPLDLYWVASDPRFTN